AVGAGALENAKAAGRERNAPGEVGLWIARHDRIPIDERQRDAKGPRPDVVSWAIEREVSWPPMRAIHPHEVRRAHLEHDVRKAASLARVGEQPHGGRHPAVRRWRRRRLTIWFGRVEEREHAAVGIRREARGEVLLRLVIEAIAEAEIDG